MKKILAVSALLLTLALALAAGAAVYKKWSAYHEV